MLSEPSERDEGHLDDGSAIVDSPELRAELRGQLQRLRSVEASVQSFMQGVQDMTASLGQHTSQIKDTSGMTQLVRHAVCPGAYEAPLSS